MQGMMILVADCTYYCSFSLIGLCLWMFSPDGATQLVIHNQILEIFDFGG
jgi:hypothetical protein